MLGARKGAERVLLERILRGHSPQARIALLASNDEAMLVYHSVLTIGDIPWFVRLLIAINKRANHGISPILNTYTQCPADTQLTLQILYRYMRDIRRVLR